MLCSNIGLITRSRAIFPLFDNKCSCYVPRVNSTEQGVFPVRSKTMVIRVKGGFIENVEGNPVPVRVYDYDASYDAETSDRDEEGRPCIISEYEPASSR